MRRRGPRTWGADQRIDEGVGLRHVGVVPAQASALDGGFVPGDALGDEGIRIKFQPDGLQGGGGHGGAGGGVCDDPLDGGGEGAGVAGRDRNAVFAAAHEVASAGAGGDDGGCAEGHGLERGEVERVPAGRDEGKIGGGLGGARLAAVEAAGPLQTVAPDTGMVLGEVGGHGAFVGSGVGVAADPADAHGHGAVVAFVEGGGEFEGAFPVLEAADDDAVDGFGLRRIVREWIPAFAGMTVRRVGGVDGFGLPGRGYEGDVAAEEGGPGAGVGRAVCADGVGEGHELGLQADEDAIFGSAALVALVVAHLAVGAMAGDGEGGKVQAGEKCAVAAKFGDFDHVKCAAGGVGVQPVAQSEAGGEVAVDGGRHVGHVLLQARKLGAGLLVDADDGIGEVQVVRHGARGEDGDGVAGLR